MFLAIIYSTSDTSETKYNRLNGLWYFYKLIHSFNEDEIIFIVENEDYFKDPNLLKPENLHGLGENEEKIYKYNVPTIQKLEKYKKILINIHENNELEIFKTEKEYREYTHSNVSTGLIKILSKAYFSIKQMGILISAVLYHGDIPSVSNFCKIFNLPFISLELGPFRNWTFANNALFSIGGIYNIDIVKKRFENFKNDSISLSLPIYEKKEILSIFLEDGYEEDLYDQLPQYDLGVAFPYAYLKKKKFNELLKIIEKFNGSILGRFHPTDSEKIKLKYLNIDNSIRSIDFIKKCKIIISAGSNITMEAILFNKIVIDIGESQFSCLAHKKYFNNIKENNNIDMINFCAFSVLVPFELCYDKKYITWRLENPSETDIYLKHLNYWKKFRGKSFTKRINMVKEDLYGSLEEIIIKQYKRKETIMLEKNKKFEILLNNKLGHIEQLIESERKLKGELNNKTIIMEQLIESKRKLENELTEYKDNVEFLLEKKCLYERELIEKNENLEKKIESERSLEGELNNKTIHIEQLLESERQLEGELNNKTIHIEQLLESERQLEGELSNKTIHVKQLIESERFLKEKLENNKLHIEQLLESERKLSLELDNKNIHIEKLLNAQNKLDSIIKVKNVELNNKLGHIEQLILSERKLNNDIDSIINSRSWKLASKLSNITRNIFPIYSKRRLMVKMVITFLCHPFKFISKISPKRIWIFLKVLKTEGTPGVKRRMDKHMKKEIIPNYSQEINIIEHSEDNNILNYEPIVFFKNEQPMVSIIIPVYNQFNYTYNCLKSIFTNSGVNVKYEIIIANDCSNDLTLQINEIITNIIVITTNENLKFLKNCNNAAKYANGKYILFLNNDTQVQKNWLLPLIELIEKDVKIGAVGSKLIYENGLLQEAGGILWNDASAWNYGRMCDPALPEFNYVKEVDYISGAALMIKKEIWDKLGGFDNKFAPAYYEDSDICFSIRKLGYKVMYQPLSVVVHFEGVTNGTDLNEGQKKNQVVNQEIFLDKWKDILIKENYENGNNIFYARDRNRNKKTLLMIDHYVPQYDKDAGSTTVYQYLKLFVNVGFNIIFIGDNFFKHEPYSTELEQMGIEILYGNYYAQNWKLWLENNGKYIDYIILNRPHISVKYIDEIKMRTKAKIIYYGHDLHYLREEREYEIKGDKNILKSIENWKNIEFGIMSKSDIIYYPSQIEVNIIKSINPNINIKAIPAYLYNTKIQENRNIEYTNNILFIGGFQHNPNVDGIIWYANEIFPIINNSKPEIRTFVLGSNPPEEILKLNSENIIITGFVTDEQLLNYYRNCRISIIPLRYGAGVKGKTVEAVYYQIPIVTTTIGAEGIQNAEEFMFIKDDPKDFAEEIIRIYDDYELLSNISKKEINIINESFTFEAAKKIIANDFDL